jgi:hypothetical protein
MHMNLHFRLSNMDELTKDVLAFIGGITLLILIIEGIISILNNQY